MSCKKGISERIRGMKDDSCDADNISRAVFGEAVDCRNDCGECFKRIMNRLADAIEEEQKRTKTEHDGVTDIDLTNDLNEVDVDALLKLANKFDSYTQHGKRSGYASMTFSTIAEWACTIRDAVKGANPSKSMRFPEIARKPPLPEQAPKVAEEAIEVQRAVIDQGFRPAAVEAMDVIHAAETLLRRLEVRYGIDLDDVTAGRVETIDKIEAVVEGLPAREAYLLGQIVRYVDRCELKHDDPADDLAKANNYAHRLARGEWRA